LFIHHHWLGRSRTWFVGQEDELVGTLLLGIAGAIVIGIGVYQIKPGASWRAGLAPMLLCALGLALVAAGAAQAQRWSERMMIAGPYIACGFFFGELLQRADARRRAGPILAKLGTVVPPGGVIIAIVCCAGGMISLTVSLFKPHAFQVATITAQYLFFATLLARAMPRWLMTQLGLVGLGRFIRWPDVEEYRWTQAGSLLVTTSFSRSRPLFISIPQQVRGQVEGILSENLPERRREESLA
jgi:hypothetical protein